MRIGTVKEIKNNENRVGLTPAGVEELVTAGHTVFVEKNAGLGSGFSNSDYQKAGAKLGNANQVWKKSELIIKVKEPLPVEWPHMHKNQIVFTYFHFASNWKLLHEMLKRNITCIAYETVGDQKNHPLLVPMSEVAGKMSVLMGAYYLAKFAGGNGILASGVSGVSPARTVILGTGTVGQSAAQIAIGLQMDVTLLVHDPQKIFQLQRQFSTANILKMTPQNIASAVTGADLLIGAVYETGAKAPVLVSKKLVKRMQRGSVIVDVAIDQGGCIETSRPTTHQKPVFEKFGVIHYCVANMPGAFPRTSTLALTNATLPFVLELAKNGLDACKKNSQLRNGLTTLNKKIVNESVAKTFRKEYYAPIELL